MENSVNKITVVTELEKDRKRDYGKTSSNVSFLLPQNKSPIMKYTIEFK